MGTRNRGSTGECSSTTAPSSRIFRGGEFPGRHSSWSSPVSRHGSSGTLPPSLRTVSSLSGALTLLQNSSLPRHQHPHLPCLVLRLQVHQEDRDPHVGRDGLRHRYPDTRRDGSPSRPAQEHLGKDIFRRFLNDDGFSGFAFLSRRCTCFRVGTNILGEFIGGCAGIAPRSILNDVTAPGGRSTSASRLSDSKLSFGGG